MQEEHISDLERNKILNLSEFEKEKVRVVNLIHFNLLLMGINRLFSLNEFNSMKNKWKNFRKKIQTYQMILKA